jgi:hypothetical protein
LGLLLFYLSEDSTRSFSPTTITVSISLWTGARPIKLAVVTNLFTHISVTIHGYHIATGFFQTPIAARAGIRHTQGILAAFREEIL